MDRLYSALTALLNPVAVALCLAGVARLTRRARLRRGLNITALAILVLGSNGWVASALMRSLEERYAPADAAAKADAIVVLSGGERPRLWPRPMLDLNDAGDRLVYGAMLYRRGAAPRVFCTGGAVVPQMVEFLAELGVPRDALASESASFNTHDHALNACPLFQSQGVSRVLLVTSAAHMTRAAGVFQRECPSLMVIPAPTDYRRPINPDDRWPDQLTTFIPSASAVSTVTEAVHEYVGIAYYRLRGWM
jgi:uncharacterized SAM-binding protein YcdF (DUF218 family)